MGADFVLDNSVVMAWCFASQATPYAKRVLSGLNDDIAMAPAIWPLEIGNALLVAERRKRIGLDESLKFLRILDVLAIKVEQQSTERMLEDILTLARQHQLSTYDAAYLDLARRHKLPLATQDKALRRAAESCGVSLYMQ